MLQTLWQVTLNSLSDSSVYLLVALAFAFSYTVTKFINISIGGIVLVGAYSAYFLFKIVGLAIIPSVVIAVLIAGIVGYVVDKLIYYPLRLSKASSTVLMIASLGAYMVIQACIAIIFSSQSIILTINLINKNSVTLFGGHITLIQIISLATGAIILLLTLFIKKRTLFGKKMIAINDDVEVAKIIGINVNHIIAIVFFLSSSIAGLAGIMEVFDFGISPVDGLSLFFKGAIAAIIGGAGNPIGAVAGAFLLGFAENFGILFLPGEWKNTIAFLLLIAYLLFRNKKHINL